MNKLQEIKDVLEMAWQKSANHEKLTFEETNRVRNAMEVVQKLIEVIN